MPFAYKIIVSLIVILVGALVAGWEFSSERESLAWIVLVIVAIMLLGLWVFPEAGGGKPKDSDR